MSPPDAGTLRGARVLILDADGVLRRLPAGETLDGIPRLEAFLRRPEFEDVRVVAAGEWKRHLGIRQIRRLFAPDLAERFVGATPHADTGDGLSSHVEINLWVDAHPEIAGYVVLESGHLWQCFPALESAVFVHSPEGVLGEMEIRSLERLLGSIAAPAPLVH